MPPTPTTAEMGERHVRHVAEVLGAHTTKASGATATDKADGAHHHDLPFAFRFDGKSTKGQQIAVTLAMVEKICEQAGGERPALPLRWYGNGMLTQVLADWIAVQLVDFAEVLASARAWAEVVRRLNDPLADPGDVAERAMSVRDKDAALQRIAESNESQGDIIGALAEENDQLRERLEAANAWKVTQAQIQPDPRVLGGPAIPGYIPVLPWTVIHQVHTAGTVKNGGVHYDERGYQSTFSAGEVRVERSPGSTNRPRLMVNNVRVPKGAMYVDGVLRVLVCDSNREIEVG
jgi:hypothetical protein